MPVEHRAASHENRWVVEPGKGCLAHPLFPGGESRRSFVPLAGGAAPEHLRALLEALDFRVVDSHDGFFPFALWRSGEWA